jgi:RNA polymerase sigma factor (sigma-70 family)
MRHTPSPHPTSRAARREAAFRVVYEQHGPAVHAYLARRVAPEHVEDLAAETFLVAWRKLPHDVEEPLPWLYAVARRCMLAHRRRLAGRRRLVERLAALTPAHERSAPATVVEPALGEPLARAFARLTDREKEALLLVAWERLDHAAAARVVGCTAATFTVRVSRARGKLVTALGDRPSRQKSSRAKERPA